MRVVLFAALCALAACSAPTASQTSLPVPATAPAPVTAPAMPAPAPIALDCAGSFAQGGVVVCRTEIRALVVVDQVVVGNADSEGWFVAGFDRDSAATSTIEVRGAGGAKSQVFPIAARPWSVQRIDGLPPETVTPTDPAVLERIARETEIKNKARELRAPIHGWNDAFLWPTAGRMSGPWGNQRVLNGVPKTPHYGIDIAAPTGTPIRAPAAGVIALANPDMHFEGGLIMLDHGQGLMTYYLHMSRLDVTPGQTVTQGQSLGAVGRSGRTTGPHLCWRMRWRDRNLDPSLAVQGLSVARAHFNTGPQIDAGAAPTGFTAWAPPAQ